MQWWIPAWPEPGLGDGRSVTLTADQVRRRDVDVGEREFEACPRDRGRRTPRTCVAVDLETPECPFRSKASTAAGGGRLTDRSCPSR